MPGWMSIFEEPICSSIDKLDEQMRKDIDKTLKNDTYTLEIASVGGISITEIRLQCTNCKSVAFFKLVSFVEMDWSGEGCPADFGNDND